MTLSRNQILEMVAKNEIVDTDAYVLLRQIASRVKCLNGNRQYRSIYRYNEPYLRDHTVFNEQVLLGVTHCSLAIDAAKSLFPERNINCIHRVLFSDPIILKKDETVDVVVEIYEKDEKLFFKNIYNKVAQNGYREAAAGGYGLRETVEKALNLLEKQKEANENRTSEQLYAEERNILHGSSLHTVTKILIGDKWALCELRLSDEIKADGHRYFIHPALFDGAISGSAYGLSGGTLKDSFIPLMIQNLVFYNEIQDSCLCYAEIKKKNEEIFVYDCSLCDLSGKILVEMEDVTLKHIKSKELLSKSSMEARHEPGDLAQRQRSTPKKQRPKKRTVEGVDIQNEVKSYLLSRIKPLVADQRSEINDDKNFMDLGIDSSQLIGLVQSMEKDLDIELYPTLFFEYINLGELTTFFAEQYREAFVRMLDGSAAVAAVDDVNIDNDEILVEKLDQHEREENTIVSDGAGLAQSSESITSDDIAIIGMSGVFAGSRTPDELWDKLKNKVDLINEIPLDHFDYHPWFDQDEQAQDRMYCKWGSFIDDVDKFDASFFNISPREAERMDPQLRYLLQVLYWSAEDAGCMGTIRGTNTGVYVGVCFHDYQQKMDRNLQSVEPHDGTGNAATMLANRPSFYFNLTGPSLAVDTACSSSLVAMHIARRALQNNECDMAFVAGVNLLLGSWHYRYFCSIGALSPTGRCHTFDQRADGYVPGEGIAAVLLKPLKKALRDNDRIYAIIRDQQSIMVVIRHLLLLRALSRKLRSLLMHGKMRALILKHWDISKLMEQAPS